MVSKKMWDFVHHVKHLPNEKTCLVKESIHENSTLKSHHFQSHEKNIFLEDNNQCWLVLDPSEDTHQKTDSFPIHMFDNLENK